MGTTLQHGTYERTSRFAITQHWYGSTSCECDEHGFAEVLEIHDAPDGYCAVVIHAYWAIKHGGSTFHKFRSVTEAVAAARSMSYAQWRWNARWVGYEIPGFQGTAVCRGSTPWFYAQEGDEIDDDVVVQRAA